MSWLLLSSFLYSLMSRVLYPLNNFFYSISSFSINSTFYHFLLCFFVISYCFWKFHLFILRCLFFRYISPTNSISLFCNNCFTIFDSLFLFFFIDSYFFFGLFPLCQSLIFFFFSFSFYLLFIDSRNSSKFSKILFYSYLSFFDVLVVVLLLLVVVFLFFFLSLLAFLFFFFYFNK